MDSVTERSRMLSSVGVSARKLAIVWVAGILACSAGCRSLRPSDKEGLFAASDMLSTDRIRGPLERAFQNEEDALTRGEKFSDEALKTVQIARRQYDEQKYAAALKTYRKIAKNYPATSIGEEAWFRIGEIHYSRREYPDAQEAYDKLFADYPSTRYVSDASERLFEIARIWLEMSGPAARSAIRTVSAGTSEAEPEKPDSLAMSRRFGLIPNFTDKTRPMFDTRGRARMALKSVWLNDPTGPLADDALMLTASYYLQTGDHVEADRYFEILREEYPDSPHLEDAFVLGSHVKQMSYQGPYYDGTSLVAAENLKERTLTLFPNTKDRQQVREDLNRIYLLKAQRAWSNVDLWKRKDNPRAIAVQCMQVITEFPDTKYADLARKEIRAIPPRVINDLPGMAEFLTMLDSSPPVAAESESDGFAPPDGIPGI